MEEAGTPEEHAAVEEARRSFLDNHSHVKGCGDLLWRMQFLKEAKFKQVIPPVKIDDAEDITFEKATNALRRGVSFFSALQASDGHWPGEITGPLFFLPPLVFCLYITGHVGSEIALVKTGYLRCEFRKLERLIRLLDYQEGYKRAISLTSLARL